MTTQLSKWGNSYAIRIPKPIADSAGLRDGDKVELDVAADGSLVIRPTRRKYTLDELVSKITPRNRHAETDWGGPVGKEIW